MQSFEEDHDTDLSVKYVIESVMKSVNSSISEKILSVIDSDLSAHISISKISRIVGLSSIEHDRAVNILDNGNEDQSIYELEMIDEEPIPTIVDSWVRGKVSIVSNEIDSSVIDAMPSRDNNSISKSGKPSKIKYQNSSVKIKSPKKGNESFNIDEDSSTIIKDELNSMYNHMIKRMNAIQSIKREANYASEHQIDNSCNATPNESTTSTSALEVNKNNKKERKVRKNIRVAGSRNVDDLEIASLISASDRLTMSNINTSTSVNHLEKHSVMSDNNDDDILENSVSTILPESMTFFKAKSEAYSEKVSPARSSILNDNFRKQNALSSVKRPKDRTMPRNMKSPSEFSKLSPPPYGNISRFDNQ